MEHVLVAEEHDDLTVIELALRLRWRSVVERAQLYPHELAEQDEDGLTLLHWACCNPPPLWVFEALLLLPQEEENSSNIYSPNSNSNHHSNNHHSHHLRLLEPMRQAACTKDFNSMTPLHCACACQAPVPIVALLIQACPDCVEICDQDGWTPLHFLTVSVRKEEGVLRYIHELARTLLADHPTLASAQDSSGRTVLEMLCVMYQVELHRFYYFATTQQGDLHPKMNDSLKLFWDVVCLLVDSHLPPCPLEVTAAGAAAIDDEDTTATSSLRSSSILHRLVSFPQCPVELLMCTCRQNPELLTRQDSAGNTPLHLAVHLNAHALERFLVLVARTRVAEQQQQQSSSAVRGPPPPPLVTATHIRNDHKETPLDVAIRVHCHWTSSHLLLLEANPMALEALDMDDALYPFLLARTNGCANVSFQILRGRPSLVQMGGSCRKSLTKLCRLVPPPD
jgi:ankyrin repeat protein